MSDREAHRLPLRLSEEAVTFVMLYGSTTPGNDPDKSSEWVISFSRDMRGTAGLTICQVSA